MGILSRQFSETVQTAPGTPDRRTKYDQVAVRKDTGILFNIDSQAPTERGIKHIRELIKAKKTGYHAILAFVI